VINTLIEVMDHQITLCSSKLREAARMGGNEDPRLIQLALEFQRLRGEAKSLVLQTFGTLGTFGADPAATPCLKPKQPDESVTYQHNPPEATLDETASLHSDVTSSATGSVRRRRIIRRIVRKRRVPASTTSQSTDISTTEAGASFSGMTGGSGHVMVVGGGDLSLERSASATAKTRRKQKANPDAVPPDGGDGEIDERDILNETFVGGFDALGNVGNESFVSSLSEMHTMPPRHQPPQRHSTASAASFSGTGICDVDAVPSSKRPEEVKGGKTRAIRTTIIEEVGPGAVKSSDRPKHTVIVKKKIVRRVSGSHRQALAEGSQEAHAPYAEQNQDKHMPTHLLPASEQQQQYPQQAMLSKGDYGTTQRPRTCQAPDFEQQKLTLLGHGRTVREAMQNAGYDPYASRFTSFDQPKKTDYLQAMQQEDTQSALTQEEIRTTARLHALLDEQLLRDQALQHIETEGAQLANVAAQLNELAIQNGEAMELIEDEVVRTRARATEARREIVRAAPKYRLPLGWIGSIAGAALAGPTGFFIIGLGIKGALIISGAGAVVGAIAGRGVSSVLAANTARQGMIFKPKSEELEAPSNDRPGSAALLSGSHRYSDADEDEDPVTTEATVDSEDESNQPHTRGWKGFSQLFESMQDDIDPTLERSFIDEDESDTDAPHTYTLQSSRAPPAYLDAPNPLRPQLREALPARSPTTRGHGRQEPSTQPRGAILTRVPTAYEWENEQRLLPRRYDIQPEPADIVPGQPVYAGGSYYSSYQTNVPPAHPPHPQLHETPSAFSFSESLQAQTDKAHEENSGFLASLTSFFTGSSSKKPSVYTTPVPKPIHDCNTIANPQQQQSVYRETDILPASAGMGLARGERSNNHHGPSFAVVSSELEAPNLQQPVRRPLPDYRLTRPCRHIEEAAAVDLPPFSPTDSLPTRNESRSENVIAPYVTQRRHRPSQTDQAKPQAFQEFEPASIWEPPPLFESREQRRARLQRELRAAAQAVHTPVSSAPMLEDDIAPQTQHGAWTQATRQAEDESHSSHTSKVVASAYEAVTGMMGTVSGAVASGTSSLIRALDLHRKPAKRDWSVRWPTEEQQASPPTSAAAGAGGDSHPKQQSGSGSGSGSGSQRPTRRRAN